MIRSLRLVQWIRLGFGLAAITTIAAAAAVPAPLAPESPGPLAPTSLRCEYLVNPIGVDVVKPRFFWVLEHPERGQVQSAYQVFVSTDPQAATGDIWDSGKVDQAQQLVLRQQAHPLL